MEADVCGAMTGNCPGICWFIFKSKYEKERAHASHCIKSNGHRLFQNDEGPLFPHFEFCTSSKPPSDLFSLELIQVKFQSVEMGSNQTVLVKILA